MKPHWLPLYIFLKIAFMNFQLRAALMMTYDLFAWGEPYYTLRYEGTLAILAALELAFSSTVYFMRGGTPELYNPELYPESTTLYLKFILVSVKLSQLLVPETQDQWDMTFTIYFVDLGLTLPCLVRCMM